MQSLFSARMHCLIFHCKLLTCQWIGIWRNYMSLMKHPNGLWSSAGLKIPIHIHFSVTILTGNIAETDLDVGVRSRFIARCVQVHARLQVSVCSSYDLWLTDRYTDSNWSPYMNSSARWAKNNTSSKSYIIKLICLSSSPQYFTVLSQLKRRPKHSKRTKKTARFLQGGCSLDTQSTASFKKDL